MSRRPLAAFLALLLLPLLVGGASPAPVAAAAASGGPPPFIAASAGPEASARIDATVTRTVGGRRVTLPAAVVPALQPGDQVDVRFTDYTRPAARVNYHVDVAFITEAAPQRWLFEKSGPWDELFRNRTGGRRPGPAPVSDLRFTYGKGVAQGIPIFFIVPEDVKTRGMDGVRDYVDAHPTDFKNMSQSANTAVDKYNWFEDFLHSLAIGSLNPLSGGNSVAAIATSLGADPTSVASCYSEGGTQSQVATCIETTLGTVNYQTNINAPTEAQFFGGLVGAATPVRMASYLVSLLSVWQIFLKHGHQEYEYLPTTLDLATPSAPGKPSPQLLMGLKVPALRPPAATSDALFFTIGDPQAATSPPVVVNAAASEGVCARDARLEVPLHLDRTSKYVHDTELEVTPDGRPPYAIPIDPHSLGAPVVPRDALTGADDGGYTVRLDGRFGFEPIVQPDRVLARIAVPRPATWSVAPLPHHEPIAGGTLDVVASSADAPCLSRAEMQIGSAPPIPLKATHLDDRRVELVAALKDVPPGEARVRFYQDDPVHRTMVESASTLAIAPQPAQVTPASAIANIGDPFVALSGNGFEKIAAVRVAGTTYKKDPDATSTFACFSGPPLGGNGAVPGESVSSQLVTSDGSPGEVFVTRLNGPRPALNAPSVTPNVAVHPASDPLAVTLGMSSGELPAQWEVRIRRAGPPRSPCAALNAQTTFGVVPAADVHVENGSQLAAVVHPTDELHDNAFGTLQIQLVDTQTKSTSEWLPLPGTFVREPQVSRILCPADPAAPCTMLGTGLSAIAAIANAQGAFVPPDSSCTASQKGQECLQVPHAAHYTLQLEDAKTTLPVPDAVVTTAAPPAPATTQAPAPTSSAHP
ncbi:MAG TPA: hypothetical protein VMA36_14225 [Candidatus Limnocylindria bacterium]|jgi:hypothetical protein|nr:hypothetical protein [Candidatus Limnocylindria bacterium]